MKEGAGMIGNDAFTEIHFETTSGNIYRIYETPDHKWALMNFRSNQGKGREAKGVQLSEGDLEKGVLKVGQPFEYGKDGRTTEITKITAVNGRRIYDADWLHRYTTGVTSDIREREKRIINPQEQKK